MFQMTKNPHIHGCHYLFPFMKMTNIDDLLTLVLSHVSCKGERFEIGVGLSGPKFQFMGLRPIFSSIRLLSHGFSAVKS